MPRSLEALTLRRPGLSSQTMGFQRDSGLYRGNVGIMEHVMETTILGLYSVLGLGG